MLIKFVHKAILWVWDTGNGLMVLNCSASDSFWHPYQPVGLDLSHYISGSLSQQGSGQWTALEVYISALSLDS